MKIKLGPVCATKTKCRNVPHSLNRRMHWAERKRWNDVWRDEVQWRIRERYPHVYVTPPPEYAILTITIKSIHPQDFDNSVGSAKPIVDALKNIIIKDDDAQHCKITYTILKVDHKADECVEIETHDTNTKSTAADK